MPGQSAVHPARTIALINQKGGVGKTTTTVNLGAAIAQMGKRVLIVDMDPQAHATIHLGVELAPGDPSVYELLIDPGLDPWVAIREVRPGLFVLPAKTDLAAAESELADEPDRVRRLRGVLGRVQATDAGASSAEERGPMDFVLIDCPPSLGLLTLNSLAAAYEVYIPMQAHFLALQGVSKLLETVQLLSKSVNDRLFVTGVILCMHDGTTTHTKEVVADLDGFFQAARQQAVPWRAARVYRPAIRRNIKLAECPSFGQTIFEYAPTCPGAQDYRELAQTIVGEWERLLSKRAEAAPTVQVAPQREPTASESGA